MGSPSRPVWLILCASNSAQTRLLLSGANGVQAHPAMRVNRYMMSSAGMASPVLFTGTLVVCLERFKTAGVDGQFAIWHKDTRVIQCPHLLQIRDSIYVLVAMVGHSGNSRHGGHYTAMVRNATDKCWYFCDDHSVQKCCIQPSRGETLTKLCDKSDLYILFYQKHVLVEPADANSHANAVCGIVKPDSPETQAMRKCMNTTPKRQQAFPPNTCKVCGRFGCGGTCMQRF